jgi:hypothetical protein
MKAGTACLFLPRLPSPNSSRYPHSYPRTALMSQKWCRSFIAARRIGRSRGGLPRSDGDPGRMRQFKELHALNGDAEWYFSARQQEGHVCVKSVSKQVEGSATSVVARAYLATLPLAAPSPTVRTGRYLAATRAHDR